MMRILLIYLEALTNEPIGLMYIGTILKRAGYSVKIIGIPRNNLERELSKELSRLRPDIIGISMPTPLVNKGQRIAEYIKYNFSGVTVIAGGPHPTILPHETLKDRNIDICVIGEGETTIIDLIESLSSLRPLEEVKGIAFLKDGKLIVTERREFIQDLDALPFVDRELMPKKVIYNRAGYPLSNPCMLLMTVRGCPYNCSFCQPTVDKMFGKKVRRRSPENVVEEIIELKREYGINGLWINDDTFSFNRAWTEKFCDSLIKENTGVSWYTNGRLNNIDRDILIKMRRAGCVGLVLTPETGSERIRNDVLNKNIPEEKILDAYKICHEIGMPFQANIMVGSPTETEEDLKSSIALIKKIQPHFMNTSHTTLLPGTYLYEKYFGKISSSPYYKTYEDYDIGRFKKLDCDISNSFLEITRKTFEKNYGNTSFRNRFRHFFKYPYFRKILYKRWKTLIFSRHPNLKHLLFDIAAIILGSVPYFKNRKIYKSEIIKTA